MWQAGRCCLEAHPPTSFWEDFENTEPDLLLPQAAGANAGALGQNRWLPYLTGTSRGRSQVAHWFESNTVLPLRQRTITWHLFSSVYPNVGFP